MRTITQEIEHHAALAFFGYAYADQADEAGEPMRGQIMDQLPEEVDPAALCAARTLKFDLLFKFIARYPDKLDPGADSLAPVYTFAQGMDPEGADRELTPELFGHYLAMQAMGTGVGLECFGYAVRDRVPVPSAEFGGHSLERDYFETPDHG